MTATKCRRCHRPLRDAQSVSLGIGPRCAKLEALGAQGYTPTQIADAKETVELGAIVRIKGNGARRVYAVLGHHGDLYRTALTGQCSCRAGVAGKACFHAAAVQIYAGATPAPRTPIVLPAPTYIRAA
jgi:hypothetical protein